MNWIIIDELLLEVIIGIHSHERTSPQKIIINLKIKVKECKADNIHEVLDYEKLITQIKNEIKNESFYLLESLAKWITSKVLEDDRALSVETEVYKLNLLETKKLGVKIKKSRS